MMKLKEGKLTSSEARSTALEKKLKVYICSKQKQNTDWVCKLCSSNCAFTGLYDFLNAHSPCARKLKS